MQFLGYFKTHGVIIDIAICADCYTVLHPEDAPDTASDLFGLDFFRQHIHDPLQVHHSAAINCDLKIIGPQKLFGRQCLHYLGFQFTDAAFRQTVPSP